MKVAQIGNFDPPHSTENELRKALNANGHEVYTHQEGDTEAWRRLVDTLSERDFVVWTRTASELNKIPVALQDEMVQTARRNNVPVVGYHLDIWFGLRRAREVQNVPYFKLVDFMCTADGGHQGEFERAGVTHRWFPPGVSEFECEFGTPTDEFRASLGFIGNHDGSYHQEWQHRFQLVNFLKGEGCRFWPEPGKHAVRGPALRDLYASVDVCVGDACLVGPGWYWSDRVPETIGRGGVLLHPRVDGMDDHFTPGEHFETWEIGDWEGLRGKIVELQNDPDKRQHLREAGRKHVLENHTYTVRMRQLVDMLKEEGAL